MDAMVMKEKGQGRKETSGELLCGNIDRDFTGWAEKKSKTCAISSKHRHQVLEARNL